MARKKNPKAPKPDLTYCRDEEAEGTCDELIKQYHTHLSPPKSRKSRGSRQGLEGEAA